MNPLIVLATIGVVLMALAGRGSPSGAEADELSTTNETGTTPEKNISKTTLIEAFHAGELNSTQVLNYMNATGLTLGQSPCLVRCVSVWDSLFLTHGVCLLLSLLLLRGTPSYFHIYILFSHADDVYDSDVSFGQSEV